MEPNRSIILPEPWSVHMSKSRNLLYYFNHVTQESLWCPPMGTIIGGVVLSSDSAGHKENCSRETKPLLCPPNEARGPTSAVVLPPDPKDSDVTKQQIKITSSSCSRTVVNPEISTRSGDSSEGGSGRVSSSMTRKRSHNQSPCNWSTPKFHSPDDTDSSASHNELRLDRTPAATRMENLKKLLTRAQAQQKKSSGLSSNVASSSQGSSSGSCASLDQKRCKVMLESPGKRIRLNVSGEGTRNAVEMHAEIQPRCGVTSTTMTSSTVEDRYGDNSNETLEPESPKPGEKLPYLDSDSDDANNSSSGKDVSSSVQVPNPALSNLHRKENIRRQPFGSKTSPIVNNVPQPLQNIAGNSPANVTSKTEQTPSVSLNKNWFSDELSSGECSVNANVSSVRSSSSSTKGDSQINAMSRIESKPSVSPVKKLFSDGSANERCASTARVSVQSRLSIAASGRGSCSSSTGSRTEALSPDNKLLADKLPTGRSESSTRVSVQNRLVIAASGKGNSQTAEGWASECSRKRVLEEPLSDSSYVAKRLVQSRLGVTTLNRGDSQINVISKIESKPSVSPVKKLFSDGLANERREPNAHVSVQSRLSIAAPGRGNSQTAEGWVSECSRKRVSEEPLSDSSYVAKRSVQSRLGVTTLNRGNRRSNAICRTEENPSDSPYNKFPSDKLHNESPASSTSASVENRLSISASGEVPQTTAKSTLAIRSRVNEQCSKTGKIKNKLFNHSSAEPSDDNLSAIEKFRKRIGLAVHADDKKAGNSPCASSDKIGGEMKLSNQSECGNPDRFGYDRNAHEPTLWKSSGYDSAVTDFRTPDRVSYSAEETMEVDALESPVETTLGHINKLHDDVASISSFVSEIPGTIAKGIKNCQEWVHEIRPPSPVDTYDLFPSEELANDEAMEWADIELDLSQVVSNLPTKIANADEWFIVVDTNILIHSLSIVQELRDTPFSNLGLPVLVIPWQVLQELDRLKNQDNQNKSSDVALGNKARWAIQFLNNNLKERHPRVRGQTAHDSEFEHYKRQGADDGILQCCLQLKEKGNFAVILTNDKNFANKAIVSGISCFTADEIMDKLHEIALQTQSPVSQKQARETALAGSPTDFEKTKYDLVFCHLKMLLKDILTEVLTSGMKKVYGNMWLQRTGMKRQWTLYEIVCCIIKNWNTMKEHEFRQNTWPSKGEKLISCPQDIRTHLSVLQTFLKNTSRKCFEYLSRDMKYVINSSIEVCIGMTAVSFREKLIETINKLEILQDICKEKSREIVMNLLSDIKALTSTATVPVVETERAQSVHVRQKFIEIWTLLSAICGSLFDALKIKHDFKYEMKYEFENLKFICDKTAHVWPHLKALNKCFQKYEVTPEDELSEDHQLVMDMYFHMKNIHPDSDRDFDETLSPHLVYTYIVHSKGRQIIMQLKEGFEKFEEQLMRGIIHISEKYPDLVNDNPPTDVFAENSAINDINSGCKINGAYV